MWCGHHRLMPSRLRAEPHETHCCICVRARTCECPQLTFCHTERWEGEAAHLSLVVPMSCTNWIGFHAERNFYHAAYTYTSICVLLIFQVVSYRLALSRPHSVISVWPFWHVITSRKNGISPAWVTLKGVTCSKVASRSNHIQPMSSVFKST